MKITAIILIILTSFVAGDLLLVSNQPAGAVENNPVQGQGQQAGNPSEPGNAGQQGSPAQQTTAGQIVQKIQLEAGAGIKKIFDIGELPPPPPSSPNEKRPPRKEALYKYHSGMRKDPFLPIIMITKEVPKEKKFILNRGKVTPMEDYELNTIKILGIVKMDDEYVATALLPNGQSFLVRKGARLGKQGGKVTDIGLNKVVVVEEYFDYKGRKNIIETLLTLGK